MDLNILRSPESENHIFSIWFVYVSVISITQKQIIAESSNLVFYNCIVGRCYLKLFKRSNKNSVYRGTLKNSNTLWPKDGISC